MNGEEDRSPKAAKTPRPRWTAEATFPAPRGARGREKARATAALLLRPSSGAATIAAEYLKPTFGEQNIGSLADTLEQQTSKLKTNDLSECEALLFGQAQALQAIFVSLTRSAAAQSGLQQWEAYFRIALRAQNQCRMTLETVATIKNPQVVFARQANIAAGPQQVNNALPQSTESRARETEIPQTQLSGGGNELLPDARAPGLASAAGPALETVGALDRT